MKPYFENVVAMTKGYLDAIEFTDFGDEDQPPKGCKFSPMANYEALAACSEFLMQFSHLVEQAISAHDYSYEQAGHDFWLTRNGHGAGFWDRGLDSQIEDEQGDMWNLGDALTSASKMFGEIHVFQHTDELVYFE